MSDCLRGRARLGTIGAGRCAAAVAAGTRPEAAGATAAARRRGGRAAVALGLGLALAAAMSAPAGDAHAKLAPRHLLRASGLTALYAGGPGSLAVTLVTRDPGEKDAPERPVPGAKVSVLLDSDGGRALFAGTTDAAGSVVARFTVPAGLVGAHRLRVVSSHADGDQSLVVDVDVRDPSDERLVHLATDKPLYQPSQTIHFRALVVRALDLHALAGAPVVFEVRAPGDVLVHRAEVAAGAMGVASSELELGPEVPLGPYTVRATSGATKVERSVTVSKYALAASKVDVELDRPYYRPGDRLVAKIKATYSFGRPVAGASLDLNVVVSPSGSPVSVYRTYATTDAEGRYTLDYRLPLDHWALPKGFARAALALDVVATDRGGETITASESSTVAEDVLMTKVVPGRDPLVAGVPNPVFVIVHYPDGKPAADCAVRLEGWGEAITGAAGIARFDVTPKAEGTASLRMELADAFGNRADAAASVAVARAGLVVRAERSLYHADEKVTFEVLVPEAARGSGFVSVDVARR
ncbi:MAG TPA: MG2 domain-containing protein, partial [Myxococcota bacterium]|nr:MG2 domain-containing protein [Myxococcota bacterium]